MNSKTLLGSSAAVALLGLGMLAGSITGASHASAQTVASTGATAPVVQAAAATATPGTTQTAPTTPGKAAPGYTAPSAANVAVTQAQAEAAALAASPGNTIDHTILINENGTPVWDVDFTNGGGVTIDANTGTVIATEAAGTDTGGPGPGHGPRGADQAALAAQATVTQAQAEAAALAASPGNTVDHSRLGQENGTVFWDVDFTNGGGVKIDAKTGTVIATEAAGTDHPDGGHGPGRGAGWGPGGGSNNSGTPGASNNN